MRIKRIKKSISFLSLRNYGKIVFRAKLKVRKMYIVKNGKPNGKVFILKDAEKELDFVTVAFCGIVKKITGVKITCEVVDSISDNLNGVAFLLDNCVENGFLVIKTNSLVTVGASNEADVYFGAIDLIEKNC